MEVSKSKQDKDKLRLWHEMYGKSFQEELTSKPRTGYMKRAQIIIGRLDEQFAFDALIEAFTNYGKEKGMPAKQTDLLRALTFKATSIINAVRMGNAVNY